MSKVVTAKLSPFIEDFTQENDQKIADMKRGNSQSNFTHLFFLFVVNKVWIIVVCGFGYLWIATWHNYNIMQEIVLVVSVN